MSNAITAKLIDHQVLGDDTLISSSTLATGLIQNQSDALALIQSRASSVTLDQIFIDSSGRVIIRNPEFAADVKSKLANASMAKHVLGNGTCGLGC